MVSKSGALLTSKGFSKSEVLIGSYEENDIVLLGTDVDSRHARIFEKSGNVILIDLKSKAGTFVNGNKVTAPLLLTRGDRISIADFVLEITW